MIKKLSITLLFLSLCFILPANIPAQQKVTTAHGISLFGDLAYKANFKNFNYVNPDAPKGGTLVLAVNNFDNINPYIATGTNIAFLGGINGAIAELLMTPSLDEPNSVYGLIAESVTYPDDNSWIEFKIRDIAKWRDGNPITPEDIIFTYQALKDKGAPTFSSYFAEVTTVEKKGNNSVRFTFSRTGDRNLIYRIAANMPVFCKHYWEKKEFDKPTLEVPIMSGPYNIKIDVGNSMTCTRVKDYWGKDLPVNKGRYNFDTVRLDVYRDANISYEAFISGNVDYRGEQALATWKTGYDVNAVRKGFIQKKEYSPQGSMMFLGIGINGRRDKFKSQKTREALAFAFDWEWTNKTIYYSMYSRERSYFTNTDLEHQGPPKGLELKLLEPFRKKLDPRVFTQQFDPPKTDGTQASLRNNLRQASKLLKEAGWAMKKGKLYDKAGKAFEIEIILLDPTQEPTFAPFVENMKLLGISAKMTILDSATFWPRYFQYDWDMTLNGLFPHSLMPGAEFRQFWGSAAADAATSFNGQGIKSPVVDALIEKVVAATDRPAKLAACHALDRVLCWNYYSIPLWYWNKVLIAYWDRFGFPKNMPKYSRTPSTDVMWVDKNKDEAVSKVRGSAKR